MTSTLASVVTPLHRFTRSANLDRDNNAAALDGYHPTSAALEATRRVVDAFADPAAYKAISVTGPYGTGKSTFALFLSSLLGPDGKQKDAAIALLGKHDKDTARRLTKYQRSAANGTVLILATARREPITATLQRAVSQTLPDLPSAIRRKVEQKLAAGHQGVVDAVTTIASHQPALLVIDELGKNLEQYVSTASPEADLYVLQQLAEWAQGSPGQLALVTLQHLSFADYDKDKSHSREWSKIQGRFLDLPFNDSPEEQQQLIAEVFQHSLDVSNWAENASRAMDAEGHSHLLTCDTARIYPLHPVTAAVLPDICARYGQNERTLFSFLAGHESLAVPAWLHDHDIQTPTLPSVRLDRVWDFFAGTTSSTAAATQDASRLMEIQARLRDHAGLDSSDLRILKAVAVLNLVADGGHLRASKSLVRLACADGQPGSKAPIDIDKALGRLQKQGLLTYRAVSDEYRIWQGSDYDITAVIEAERGRLSGTSTAGLLQAFRAPAPVVAARHSQRVGVLRAFGRLYYDGNDVTLKDLDGQDLDGLVILSLADDPTRRIPDQVRDLASEIPLLLGVPAQPKSVVDAALDLAAHQAALRTATHAGADWVALRELRERHAAATTHLDLVLEEQFGPTSSHVRWYQIDSDGVHLVRGKRTLSAVLSTLCDERYPSSALVRNEMLARRALTSQGARARRELLTAMIEHPHEPRLGLEGYAPERAMYEALLGQTGIHRIRDGIPAFGEPRRSDPLGFSPAWKRIDTWLASSANERDGLEVADLYRLLMAPPYGMKEGVIPILLVAALLAQADTVAIFETGTFVARLTTPVMERLIRNPELFTVRKYPLSPARRTAIQHIAETLHIDAIAPPGIRNAAVVTVVSGLLARVRALPDYSLQTRDLTPTALLVRDALLAARDPEALLFTALPESCGLTTGKQQLKGIELETFATTLHESLENLSDAYPRLLRRAQDTLAAGFRLPSRTLRRDLQHRLSHMRSKRFDPSLDAVISALTDPALDDNDWIEFVAMLIAGKPAQRWTDHDADTYETRAKETATRLRNLEAITFDQTRGHDQGIPLRVGITKADGADTSRVVWIDTLANRALEDIVNSALARAESELGATGREALLARIAVTVLAETTLPEEESAEGASA